MATRFVSNLVDVRCEEERFFFFFGTTGRKELSLTEVKTRRNRFEEKIKTLFLDIISIIGNFR